MSGTPDRTVHASWCALPADACDCRPEIIHWGHSIAPKFADGSPAPEETLPPHVMERMVQKIREHGWNSL